jgi:hypothetical protein
MLSTPSADPRPQTEGARARRQYWVLGYEVEQPAPEPALTVTLARVYQVAVDVDLDWIRAVTLQLLLLTFVHWLALYHL